MAILVEKLSEKKETLQYIMALIILDYIKRSCGYSYSQYSFLLDEILFLLNPKRISDINEMLSLMSK
jgi:hypothetical protein